ncbi:leader peptide SpeFL [Vibrio cholerae]|nr:leader peptide SpeFL [Vibrio cholerae]
MKKKSKIMAHIRRTRHIMMPSHRDYSFFTQSTSHL